MSAVGGASTSPPRPQSVTAPPPPEMVKEKEETERDPPPPRPQSVTAPPPPENAPVELIMTLALDLSMAGSEG